MLDAYLPAIVALIVGAITAYVNLRLGKLKTNVDIKSAITTSNDALRDDLLEMIERYDKKIEKYEEHNQTLQDKISELREEITNLRIENRNLKDELKRTQDELAKFERKVFYRSNEEK